VERKFELQLEADGSLEGEAREVLKGAPASGFREVWLNASEADRQRRLKSSLGQQSVPVEVRNIAVTDLDLVRSKYSNMLKPWVIGLRASNGLGKTLRANSGPL
jgi:hypothetical protein